MYRPVSYTHLDVYKRQVLGKLAEDGKPAYEILKTYKGTELEYKEYEPLFQCAADAAAKQNKKAFYVVCDEYVTLTDGTGVVHIAPAFGEDDANVGRKYDLPFVQLVDEDVYKRQGDRGSPGSLGGLYQRHRRKRRRDHPDGGPEDHLLPGRV